MQSCLFVFFSPHTSNKCCTSGRQKLRACGPQNCCNVSVDTRRKGSALFHLAVSLFPGALKAAAGGLEVVPQTRGRVDKSRRWRAKPARRRLDASKADGRQTKKGKQTKKKHLSGGNNGDDGRARAHCHCCHSRILRRRRAGGVMEGHVT